MHARTRERRAWLLKRAVYPSREIASVTSNILGMLSRDEPLLFRRPARVANSFNYTGVNQPLSRS